MNNILSPFFVCVDSIFACVVVYMPSISTSSSESSVLLNSFSLTWFFIIFAVLFGVVFFCCLSVKVFPLIHLPYCAWDWQNQDPAVVHVLPSDHWKLCSTYLFLSPFFLPSLPWHCKFIHFNGFILNYVCVNFWQLVLLFNSHFLVLFSFPCKHLFCQAAYCHLLISVCSVCAAVKLEMMYNVSEWTFHLCFVSAFSLEVWFSLIPS